MRNACVRDPRKRPSLRALHDLGSTSLPAVASPHTVVKAMLDDKRGLPRYPARLVGQYELLLGRPAERLQPTETIDVGLRGCRLVTGPHAEVVGARVVVVLAIGDERVRMPGTIVWVRKPRGDVPGIMGVDLEPPIPRAYGELVAELAARHSTPEPRRATPLPTVAAPAPSATRAVAMTAAERLRAGLRAGRDSSPGTQVQRPPRAPKATPAVLPIVSSLGLLPSVPVTPPARPAAPVEPAAPVPAAPSLQELDAVLLAFLAGARASAPPPPPATAPPPPASAPARSAPDTDAMLREFLANTTVPAAAPSPSQPARPARSIDRLLRGFLAEVRTSGPVPVQAGRIDALLRDFLADPAPDEAPEPAPSGADDFSDQEIDALVGNLSSQEIDLLDQLRAAVAWSSRVLQTNVTRPAVLLVHDDAAVLDAHTREIGPLLDIVRASSLEQALAVLDRRDIELRAVVTDAAIEGDASAGIVLLQQARRRLPGCARVLVTGLRGELAEGYVRQGVAGRALAPSYRPGELLAALRELLPVE